MKIYRENCIDCNCPVYWDDDEEKLISTSDVPDHVCELEDEDG